MHRPGEIERWSPVSDCHRDLLRQSLLQKLCGFVRVPTSNIFPVNLKNLVAESQSHESSGRIVVHKGHKHTLKEEKNTQFYNQSHSKIQIKSGNLRSEISKSGSAKANLRQNSKSGTQIKIKIL